MASVSELGPELRRSGPAERVSVFVDATLADSEVLARAVDSLGEAGTRVTTVTGDARADELTDLANDLAPDEVVVGVGGGAVIDRVKLMSLLASDPSYARNLMTTQRCGFVILPERVRRTVRLAVVPTTVGTGAEASRTACLRRQSSKKLVYGDTLRPDVAAVDAVATRQLPLWLLAEGTLEVLIRVASYYVGHHADRPGADQRAEEMVAEVVRLGYAVSRARSDRVACPAAVRARIATLSGRSHRQEMLEGLAPYSDTCWPLANELSMCSGARKLTGLAIVLPTVWRRVLDGEVVWGSEPRLRRLWDVVRDAAPESLDPDCSVGIDQLMTSWSIDRRVECPDLDEVAHRAARAWGQGLPMLRGLTTERLRSIYGDAFSGSRVLTSNTTERR